MVTDTTPRPRGLSKVTDEDIAACRTADGLVRAMAIVGMINAEGTTAICPSCGKADNLKQFSIKADGGYKHFSSGGCWAGRGAGIDLLRAAPLNLSFPDAVRAIVGKPTSVQIPLPETLPTIVIDDFTAVTDVEVFNGVLNYGRRAFGGEGLRAAQEFYAQWHIDPDVVDSYGAVLITRPDHFNEQIQARFGAERLIACGLFKRKVEDDGSERVVSLVGKKWPVVEPNKNAAGDVTNLQFRASNRQYQRYLRHKAKELPYEGNQKFINLRGVPTAAYLGCGLDVVAKLPDGVDLFWVEGFKDTLAGATMGVNTYGVPGTSFRPPKQALDVLRRFNNVLALDGDGAGQEGMYGVRKKDADGKVILDDAGQPIITTPGLLDYLAGHDLRAHVYTVADSLDITDSLVKKHALDGCGCAECVRMRKRLGL